MRVGHIGAHLQPFFHLIVGFQTPCQTLVIRFVNDTFVVQVAHRSIERRLVRSSRNAYVVLLAQACAICLVQPVVRTNQVILSVVIDNSAQSGVRVQLAVDTNQVLAFGHRVDVISQAIVARAEHVGVGAGMSGSFALSLAQVVVLQRAIIHFIILRRVCDVIVIPCSARIGTPLRIHSHRSLARSTLLGRNDNHAVSAASAIQGIGSRILQHRHRLNVLRADVVQVALVRRTVQDNQRVVAGIDRADTTNADGRARGARLSGSVVQLHAGHFTLQRIGRIGSLDFINLVGVHHRGRTRKRRLLGRTVSHYHHLVQQFGVGLHPDCHIRPR